MKYKRFEDLPVWQSAMDLADRIYDFVENAAFTGQGDLRNQLQRASLSISNNVAEGFERGTTTELINFLYIARGSAGEVRSMLCFIERRKRHFGSHISNLKSEISNLKSLAESTSRQLCAWAESLQNSDIKGQRHLTDRERDRFDRKQSRDAFFDHLDQVVAASRQQRDSALQT